MKKGQIKGGKTGRGRSLIAGGEEGGRRLRRA